MKRVLGFLIMVPFIVVGIFGMCWIVVGALKALALGG